VEESASSEMEEVPTRSFSVRIAGNVGAPATVGSSAPTGWKKKKNFGWLWYTWTGWHLKEAGAGEIGGETQQTSWAMRRTVRPTADVWKHSPRKRIDGSMPVGYSQRAALRREQCDL
jgi:hypothetical protein